MVLTLGNLRFVKTLPLPLFFLFEPKLLRKYGERPRQNIHMRTKDFYIRIFSNFDLILVKIGLTFFCKQECEKSKNIVESSIIYIFNIVLILIKAKLSYLAYFCKFSRCNLTSIKI